MRTQLCAAAFLVACVTAPVGAQEFRGDITLGYSTFWDDTRLNTLTGTGSYELGFGESASAQLDLRAYGFNWAGVEAGNVVLHGIYDLAPTMSAGVFVGYENFAGDRYDFYGLEFGQSLGTGGFEVYAARGEEGGVSGTVIGAEGSYPVNGMWDIGVKLDNADFGTALDVRRFGVKGSFALGSSTSLFAEVGSARMSVPGASVSEPFVGVGLNVRLGGGKATFGQRSLAGLVPGL